MKSTENRNLDACPISLSMHTSLAPASFFRIQQLEYLSFGSLGKHIK